MSVIKELLKGVEVEWKPLSDGENPLTELRRGRVMSKVYLAENHGDFPVYSSQTANNGEIGKISSFDFDGEFVSWTTDGANAGTVFYKTGKFSITNVCGLIKINNEEELSYKFLFYWLSVEAKKHVYSGMGNPKLMSHQVFKIPIPIPPLHIQKEIVRILDNFTELTTELTAELTARKKQYSYYRDKLLTFEDGEVEWLPLEEVADIYDSLHQTPQYSDSWLSMVRVTDIKGGFVDLDKTLKVNDETFKVFTKKYQPKKFDLVMSRVGSYGNIGIIPTNNSTCMGQNTVVIHPQINNKFLFHLLMSKTAQSFIEKNVIGGSQKTLSLKSIKAIPIPLVNKAEQQRIVDILDKFDALTNSISEGLPKEINLRKQQYEYYRDLLLNFPKAEEVAP